MIRAVSPVIASRSLVRPVLVATAAAVVLAGCSGVPSSSVPEVIAPATGRGAVAQVPTVTPRPNAEPRQIVQDFLRANIGEPADPRGAQLFLTHAQQVKWADSTVTIVQNYQVRLPTGSPTRQVVRVDATQVGKIMADGSYTSTQPEPLPVVYTLRKVDGQWRIDDLPPGLIITAADFAAVYKPSKLYFFDLSESHLVPDLRYTALTAPQAIASWQLGQLLAGPRASLASAVRTELPGQIGVQHPSVTVAGPAITVDLPGSSSLDPGTKLNLAAQLMATLGQAQPQAIMAITDVGSPVAVPKIPFNFTKSDISAFKAVFGVPQPPVFYIDVAHRLVDADGKPVPGPLGAGAQYDLDSVAITSHGSANYAVAATIDAGRGQKLWLGSVEGGLRPTAVPTGPLTRPSWAPGVPEAWIGDGTALYRVAEGSEPVQVSTGLSGGRIRALRFSADGARLALVVDSPDGGSQVWIASVIRSGSSARLDSPEAITPPGYSFGDVAWNDDTTLYMVGHDSSHIAGVWQVQVDGSNLAPRPSAGLPTAADSITAAPTGGMLPWVSAGGAVFEETSDWEGPGNHTTIGTNPVYLE